MTQDEEHLKLLSIFHYVLGGILTVVSFLPIFHLLMGIVMLFTPSTVEGSEEAPKFLYGLFGAMFIVLPLVLMLAGWTLAALVFVTGRFLAKRKRRVFCVVIGGVECIFMPLGTVLGVFTIILLTKESMQQLFSASQTVEAPAHPSGS